MIFVLRRRLLSLMFVLTLSARPLTRSGRRPFLLILSKWFMSVIPRLGRRRVTVLLFVSPVFSPKRRQIVIHPNGL